MNIAILGYGVEGESVYNYYHAKYPDAVFTVYDNNSEPKKPLPDGVQFVGGVKDFKGIDADLAIKTPSIPPWNVEVTGEVTTMTREFLKTCSAPIIGVTGTKGKGTTASLIKSILDAAGKKTWLVGNIGLGAFDVLDPISPDDIVVYEMSSFQLWDSDVSPQTAVVLGIEPEHLDIHKDFDDYLNAKANIASHQTVGDTVVYKKENQYAARIAAMSAAVKVPYQDDKYAHTEEGSFWYAEQKLCSTDVMKLPGMHNLDNACAAIAATWSWVHDGAIIAKGLGAFDGLPHRLKFIREVGGVKYYDDSIGTTPGSAIAALRAFEGKKIIILGGSTKGADFTDLARELSQHDVHAILIGDEADRIAASCNEQGFSDYEIVRPATMQDTVRRAAEGAQPGSVVLLSPAAASFDMFKNYADRGEQFSQAVQHL